jgi:hypothetical protein
MRASAPEVGATQNQIYAGVSSAAKAEFLNVLCAARLKLCPTVSFACLECLCSEWPGASLL